MKKQLLIALTGMLTLTLAGCSSQTEPETFNQANIAPIYGSVMETDQAYYYNANDMSYELHYYDKATGKSIFLCNKPECSHNGNEFCAATAGGRYVMYSELYEDGIYVAAKEPEDNRIDFKLFKVSLDGTKLETICTYANESASDLIGINYDAEKYMAIYNGTAFIPYSIPQADGSNNQGIAMVDIASGSAEYLEEHNSYHSSGQKSYVPYGEYLYYCISEQYNDYPKLYRYHLSKKNHEEIPIPGGFKDYCIVEGAVVYTQQDADGFCHIYSLNPDSLERKDLTGPLTKDDGASLLKGGEGTLLFDGEYLMTFTGFDSPDKEYRYFVFSKDGSSLTEFTYSSDAEICMVDGYVYFRDYYGMVRCSMQDILDGKLEWSTLFTTAAEEENTP